jgi:hypothetical protein
MTLKYNWNGQFRRHRKLLIDYISKEVPEEALSPEAPPARLMDFDSAAGDKRKDDWGAN